MAVGQLLDEQYEVLSVLSEGTHSYVYRARERMTGLACIVKVLKTGEGKDALVRFEEEAKKLRRLDHPSVSRFQTFGATPSGEPYMVMESVEGKSLEAVLTECERLPVDKALKLFEQICDGMGIAHHLGIYHRNLKPSKIIVTSETANNIAIKIIDFGVAAVLRSDYNHIANLTKPGSTVPSPHYMSPEQCMARQTDGRADIYAFGCIMYRTLTGHKPFSGKSAIEVLAKHINESPPGFRQVAPKVSISPELEKIVIRCLEKSPEDRFASVSELRRALENFQEKGTAGAAVSHVMIPGSQPADTRKDAAKERPKDALKAKEAAKHNSHAAPAGAPHPAEQTAPEPAPQANTQTAGDASLSEPGSGTETGRMRRPRPAAVELTAKKPHNPIPILILALLLGGGAVGVAMMRSSAPPVVAPRGPEAGGQGTNGALSLSQVLALSPPEFSNRAYSELPEPAKEVFEKEDAFESQSSSGGGDSVMKQRVDPAISQTEAVFGKDSIELAWLQSRIGELLLINRYYVEAESLSAASLSLQKSKFLFKPEWLTDRTRAALVASSLANGKPAIATEQMMVLCQGKDLRRPVDQSFKSVLAKLEKNSNELSMLVSSSQIADSEVEEKLRSILSSSESVRSRNFELKTYALWYLLMASLNKKDNDKAINEVLAQLEETTKPVEKANNAVGYLLVLASLKAREADQPNIAATIDELAVKKFQFDDEHDPIYLEFKRHHPKGLPGLALRQPQAATTGTMEQK